MRMWAGVVLCIGFTLWTPSALADTIYKYRDKGSGRDVFVNRLDQIPRKYRDQAKIMLESNDTSGTRAEEPPTKVAESPAEPPPAPARVSRPAGDIGSDLRRALTGKNLWKDGPAVAGEVIDAKLITAGAKPLTAPERADFGGVVTAIIIAAIVTGLLALAAWLVLLITAVRDGRLWWALFMFLFSPLSYVYLFLYAGKGRALFKTACSLGMLSPALVGLVGAWRFHAWFSAVIAARGGRM